MFDQRWFWAHNILIRSDFWAQNSLIRNDSKRTIVWTMVWVWSGPWSHNLLDNDLVLFWSEVISVWKGLIRDSFERTLVWSEDNLVCYGLIRGYFCLPQSDQRSLPDDTSTWDMFFLNFLRNLWRTHFDVRIDLIEPYLSRKKHDSVNSCHSNLLFFKFLWPNHFQVLFVQLSQT